jgi:hypothetical protein
MILKINNDISLDTINQLISVMEIRCVLFQVGIEFLNIIRMNFVLSKLTQYLWLVYT